MMRLPYWFAGALIEQRKAGPLPTARKTQSHSDNSPDRVLMEIGVVLAAALCVAAFAELALRAGGIG